MNDFDVKLSKTLSFLLRHSADRSISIDSEGFAWVDAILSLPQMRRYNFVDIERVVRTNDKKRFALVKGDESSWYIRANQGHTFKVPHLELKSISIEEATAYGEIVHATFKKNWQSIKENGLNRMKREHIHFLPTLPNFEDRKKMSGKLKNCDLFVFVDLPKAIKDGHNFFVSANNVALCRGNENGVLETKYFSKVLTGKEILEEVAL